MNKYTSVQTGLPGISNKPAQAKMFEEFGTAPGQGGSKPGLMPEYIEALERKLNKRIVVLPGQQELIPERED